MGGDDFISWVLIGIVIGAVVFLILREIVCWYWKINKIVVLQEKQNELLEKLSGQLRANATSNKNNQEAQTSGSAHIKDDSYSDNDDDVSKDNLFK